MPIPPMNITSVHVYPRDPMQTEYFYNTYTVIIKNTGTGRAIPWIFRALGGIKSMSLLAVVILGLALLPFGSSTERTPIPSASPHHQYDFPNNGGTAATATAPGHLHHAQGRPH